MELTIELVRDNFAKVVEFGQVKVYGVSLKQVSDVKLADKVLAFKQKEHMLMFDLAGAQVIKGQPLIVKWT